MIANFFKHHVSRNHVYENNFFQETKEKLDKTIAHLKDTRSEIDQTRQECVDFMKQLKEDEKRQKAAEQEQSVKLMIDAQAATELENIKDKYQKTIEEFEIMTEKIKVLEKGKEEQEQNVIKLKGFDMNIMELQNSSRFRSS